MKYFFIFDDLQLMSCGVCSYSKLEYAKAQALKELEDEYSSQCLLFVLCFFHILNWWYSFNQALDVLELNFGCSIVSQVCELRLFDCITSMWNLRWFQMVHIGACFSLCMHTLWKSPHPDMDFPHRRFWSMKTIVITAWRMRRKLQATGIQNLVRSCAARS